MWNPSFFSIKVLRTDLKCIKNPYENKLTDTYIISTELANGVINLLVGQILSEIFQFDNNITKEFLQNDKEFCPSPYFDRT